MNFTKHDYETLVSTFSKSYTKSNIDEAVNNQYDDMMEKSPTDTSYPLSKLTYEAMCDARDIILSK